MLKRPLIAAALIVLLSATLVAAASGASHKVFVERNVTTGELAYRPHLIALSEDGTFAMTRIRWQRYGGPVALASATAYTRGCTPDCAQGKLDRPRASLRFTNRIHCQGQYIYARMHYALRGALPGGYRHRGSYSLRPLGESEGGGC
jgi:hypothetical protein